MTEAPTLVERARGRVAVVAIGVDQLGRHQHRLAVALGRLARGLRVAAVLALVEGDDALTVVGRDRPDPHGAAVGEDHVAVPRTGPGGREDGPSGRRVRLVRHAPRVAVCLLGTSAMDGATPDLSPVWDELDLPRVRAEARLVHGQQLFAAGAFEHAEDELEEAAWEAAAHEHDGIATMASGELVTLLLAKGDAEQALAWHRHHIAARKRVGDAPLPNEERMLVALIAQRAATDPDDTLQDRLTTVRHACGPST